MNTYQEGHLQRTEERLSAVLGRAERRAARYRDGTGSAGAESGIDQAFIQHLTVVLQNIKQFQSAAAGADREIPTAYLKDAVLELHELSAFTLKYMDSASPFMTRFYENEDRWVRMITISLVGLLINICTDNIRTGLGEIERKMKKLDADLKGAESPPRRGHLRVVK